MTQDDRNLAFVRFNRNESNILIATNIAARGLDFPRVDWSISMGPPDRLKDYVHRAGRTARNEEFGSALLLLAPNEEVFAKKVKEALIKIKKIEVVVSGVEFVKGKVVNAMAQGRQIRELAVEAVIGFVYIDNFW
jgi:superfamily II DNA/RNA helicase